MAVLSEKERQELSELLPFYLNGTLEAAERARVEAGLADDELLRADLDFLKVVQAETLARDAGRSPGEFGLARLMRDIDIERAQVAPPQRESRFWKLAAVACFTLFVGSAAMMLTQPDTLMELASGGTVTVHQGPVFTVAFVETATEAEIRDLLLTLDMQIASGPSALGLYTVVGPEDADVGELIHDLLSADTLVESVAEEG